jgi:hypothetical protein
VHVTSTTRRARAIIGGAALGLIVAIGLGVVAATATNIAWDPRGATVEPSAKAAVLAQSISAAINFAATATVLVPIGAIVAWAWMRRRDRSR